ncbi:hypothetical protein [Halorussus caseinilyticus]|uniref:Antitoxin SocA-like Panacea domain-containing protein n=1 Tax=Halorussus caseinilyticus TaxID=3034025 RepID=A0ABD5WIG5_9EURY
MDEAGGEVDGRTRFIKLIFLAQEKAGESFPVEYDFEAYDYGPFDKNILHDLDDLEDEGIISSQETDIGNNKKYTYRLNNQYRGNLRDELPEDLDITDEEWDQIESQAERVARQFNSVPISRLLEHVYNKYPGYTSESVI